MLAQQPLPENCTYKSDAGHQSNTTECSVLDLRLFNIGKLYAHFNYVGGLELHDKLFIGQDSDYGSTEYVVLRIFL